MSIILTEEIIRKRIKELYEKGESIHMNISIKKPRISLQNVSARIRGVYAHLFSIEVYDKGYPQIYSVQYAEILINRVEIAELDT